MQPFTQRSQAVRQHAYSIDQDVSEGGNSKFGGQVDNSGLEQIFTQSPIHGSLIQNGRGTLFASIDEFIKDTAFNTKYNSTKREQNDDE